MPKLLPQANNKFLLPPHPVNMHNDVVQWLSELEFCNVELTFFIKLLRKNNFYTSSKKRVTSYYALEIKLKKFQEKNLKTTFKGLVKHEHNLSEIDKNKLVMDVKKLTKEHNKYKLGVLAINGSVKKLKHELFAFVEKQLKN